MTCSSFGNPFDCSRDTRILGTIILQQHKTTGKIEGRRISMEKPMYEFPILLTLTPTNGLTIGFWISPSPTAKPRWVRHSSSQSMDPGLPNADAISSCITGTTSGAGTEPFRPYVIQGDMDYSRRIPYTSTPRHGSILHGHLQQHVTMSVKCILIGSLPLEAWHARERVLATNSSP